MNNKKTVTRAWIREQLKKEREQENSLEGIHYNTDFRDATVSPSGTDHEVLICEVLSKLPAGTRKKVQDNSTFFVTYGESMVTHGSGKWLVLLTFKNRQSDKSKRLTIAHEIGHVLQFLENPTGPGGYAAEKGADDFAEKYGFGRVYPPERLSQFIGAPRNA